MNQTLTKQQADGHSSRVRGPSTFEVFDRNAAREPKSHGIFDTLDEARGCVEYDRLNNYEIWQGDHIIQEDEFVRDVFGKRVPRPACDACSREKKWDGNDCRYVCLNLDCADYAYRPAEILAEHQLAETRVLREAPDPVAAIAAAVKLPAVPFGYRVATIRDLPALAELVTGTRVVLFDPEIGRLAYGLVRGWSEDGVNVAILSSDVRLSTVDGDLEPLGAAAPLTDGHYWLVMEVGR